MGCATKWCFLNWISYHKTQSLLLSRHPVMNIGRATLKKKHPVFQRRESQGSEPLRDLIDNSLHSHPWMVGCRVHLGVGRWEWEAVNLHLSPTNLSPSKYCHSLFLSKWIHSPQYGGWLLVPMFSITFNKGSLILPRSLYDQRFPLVIAQGLMKREACFLGLLQG